MLTAKRLKELMFYLLLLAAGLGVGYAATHVREWMAPRYTEGDYAAYFAQHQTQVVMYGTSHCPYCAKTRDYLREHGIAFADLDIEKSDRARQEFEQLEGRGVPVILIGNRRIVGYQPATIAAALQRSTALARQ
ncbi:glutaredoxin family protein [Duganella sp. CY15W]|uniref:glutaredoxin family protein n=1 Tax=Duganella sp. CY15W TaxID=2692172 RepID=UPI001E47A63A|nr:glutaredoxin family protein [Duganella sp. CY15W]